MASKTKTNKHGTKNNEKVYSPINSSTIGFRPHIKRLAKKMGELIENQLTGVTKTGHDAE